MLTEETASALLGAHRDTIRDCLWSGWQVWDDLGHKNAKLRKPLSTRTRASFVYDHVASEAERAFSAVAGVRPFRRYGFLGLDFGGQAVVRFKKLDKGLRTRFVGTTQALLWDHGQTIHLPGMPDQATPLVAGYVLDDLGTTITRMAITCSKDGVAKWHIELEQPGQPIALPSRQPAQPVIRTKEGQL